LSVKLTTSGIFSQTELVHERNSLVNEITQRMREFTRADYFPIDSKFVSSH